MESTKWAPHPARLERLEQAPRARPRRSPRAGSRTSSAAPSGDRGSRRARRRRSPGSAASAGNTAAIRSSASMRWMGGGLRRPPRWRRTMSARPRFQRQRTWNIGDEQQRLGERLRRRPRREEVRHVLEREALLRPEREHHGVVARRRLQLEVEAAAEALAQRQAEAAIDPAAERRVDHELHPARLVEEALEDESSLGRQHAERELRRAADSRRSPRRRRRPRPHSRSSHASAPGASCAARKAPTRARRSPTSADSSAVRAGASPSQNGTEGGAPCASTTRTMPGLDAADAPRGAAEEEDVARPCSRWPSPR